MYLNSTKIAITGHTAGLGLELFRYFSPHIIGFSRSNGFDISSVDGRNEIAKMSVDCDVFINNAHDGFHQVDMLYIMTNLWKGTNKLIINMSSNSSDGIKSYSHRYAVCKSALDKASEQLSRIKDHPRITNLRPGYLNTPSVSDIIEPKIENKYFIDMINWIINASPSFIISEMTVLPR